MKLSVFRRLKKELSSVKFFKTMVRLNPSINLKQRDNDATSFNSNLTAKDVNRIKLPRGASYETGPNKFAEYGFIRILYNSNIYTIYSRGLTGAYLAM